MDDNDNDNDNDNSPSVTDTDTKSNTDDGKKNHWRIWKAVDKLELRKDDFYPEITVRVIEILRKWGMKWQGDPKMVSLLNKSTLHHEIEETIVAIHYLFEGLSTRQEKLCHVIDACAGKGMLSFLLSYLKHPKINSIVMLEKATIDWNHIQESNKTAREENRPKIDIWSNTNLHDYDDVLDRMIALPHPIAMCGIHLCKQLGTSFCGLYNGLGEKCIYGCLSPCCMPRAVTTQKTTNAKKRKIFTLSVQLAETVEDRRARREYMLRRKRLRRRVSLCGIFSIILYCSKINFIVPRLASRRVCGSHTHSLWPLSMLNKCHSLYSLLEVLVSTAKVRITQYLDAQY